MPEVQKANEAQSASWNDAAGKSWVAMQSALDGMLDPFNTLLVDQSLNDHTRRVLDVGCGAGSSSLAAARRLAGRGSCVGADISAALLELARQRATSEGLPNLAFVQADAQSHTFEPGACDAVISRFGLMFFDDPVTAFTNLRRAAGRAAVLAFVAWRGPDDNPFMTAAARAAAPFLPDLPKPVPDAPGQFGLANPGRVRSTLTAGGWRDIEIRAVDVACSISERDLEVYSARMGPVGIALAQAEETTRRRALAAVKTGFAPFIRNGVARFEAASWLVTARG